MKPERLVWATAIVVFIATTIWYVPGGFRMHAVFRIERAKQEGVIPAADAGFRSLIVRTCDGPHRFGWMRQGDEYLAVMMPREGRNLNHREVLALFDRDQRREIAFPGAERESFPHLVRFIRPAAHTSFILYTDLDESNADAVIEEQIAFFTRLQRPFNWKVYAHDRPANLVERLLARGFEIHEAGAVLALDLSAAPDSLLAQPLADVRRLSHRSQLGDVAGILESVWLIDFSWVHQRMGDHMDLPDYLSVFVAYVDGVPACAGWTYFNPGVFAGLWGGSTREEYRGRGLYTAVLAARVQEARQRGVRYLAVDAGSMSRPIAERHGFEVITFATDCHRDSMRDDIPFPST